jgi:hypothetical protein
MAQNRSGSTKEELLDRLISIAQEMSADKIVEVVNFANALKYTPEKPRFERGSLEALLDAMNRFGPLEFEPGELETLLTEIYAMRELDLDKNDRLSA